MYDRTKRASLFSILSSRSFTADSLLQQLKAFSFTLHPFLEDFIWRKKFSDKN